MSNIPSIAKRPVIIGVVGGIASGKSFVCQRLANCGGEIIDADRLGHEVLQLPEVLEQLVCEFGTTILDNDRRIDRRRLASLVFGDPQVANERRERLERIVHPRIRALAEQKIKHFQCQTIPPKAIILDAPLLLEAHWDKLCDAVIYVEAAEEVRKSRAKERGWTEQHFADRERSQMPVAAKRARSTHVIDNNPGSDVETQMRYIWNTLVGGEADKPPSSLRSLVFWSLIFLS